MKKDPYRGTDFSLSHRIHRLYGDKPYRDFKGSHNITAAKKYYLRMLQSTRLAIEGTLITDPLHLKQLIELIERNEELVRKSKSIDELDQKMIALQAEIIFLLLGLVPNRWQQTNVPNRPAHWQLNDHRQIQYVQTTGQKKNLIFAALQTTYKDRFPDWADFRSEVYWKECNDEPQKLVEWLKRNHPDIYLELF